MDALFSIGTVTLIVRDLDAVSAFYERVMGLHRLLADAETVELGSEETVLLVLRRDAAARLASPREAGLFHTAFLLPERGDLGRWTQHARQIEAPATGASDHIVSEAIYLTDPEGNGVEIYADRPRAEWRWTDGIVTMATERLDIAGVVASGGGTGWQGFPAGSVVGHVHLQVGAIPAAEAFYLGVLGVPITAQYPGGTFYGAGGYHHHLATNIWNSRGAGMRTGPATGLAAVEILTDAATLAAVAARLPDGAPPGPLAVRDPWGTNVTLRVPE